MSHGNALLSPRGRLALARCVVEDGWSLRRAAERFQASVPTVQRWAARYRQFGAAGMDDRPSRPLSSRGAPRAGSSGGSSNCAICGGGGRPGSASTSGCIPRRCTKCCRGTRWPDWPGWTGLPAGWSDATNIPRPATWCTSTSRNSAGSPTAAGTRSSAAPLGTVKTKAGRPGYAFIHNAVDDHSRLAYSEICADERKETAAGFWTRADAFFASYGIPVRRVLTDNGACYRSFAFPDALGAIAHKRTRPYRPQTNGKVERFNRTLLEEWAYATAYPSEVERAAAFPAWLHHYNHHRGHTALHGQPPASRAASPTSVVSTTRRQLHSSRYAGSVFE